jgi:1-acyl-sn-glycerol-3-phosphate acyltransferase
MNVCAVEKPVLPRVLDFVVVVAMNLWVYPMLLVWTVVGSVIAIPGVVIWKVFTGWPIARILHQFVWIYGRVCVLIFRPFIRLECRDLRREYLPNPGIIIVNHFSFFDTFIMCLLPVYDAHICLRAWPFKMFWYYIFMRMANYFDFESWPWDKIRTESERVTRMGRYLIIFPEGHRSRTGKPGRFYSGAFKLAIELDVPVLPLCVKGTEILLPPSRWWLRPATINMQLLRPVFPDAYRGEQGHVEMRKDVHKQMVDTIEKMGTW